MWRPLSPAPSSSFSPKTKYEHNPFGHLPSLRTLDLPTMDANAECALLESRSRKSPIKKPHKPVPPSDSLAATFAQPSQPTVFDYIRQQREEQQTALASQLWSQTHAFPTLVSQQTQSQAQQIQQRMFTDMSSDTITYLPTYYSDTSVPNSSDQQYCLQSPPSYMDPCDQTIPNYYQPSANYSQTTYRRNWSDLRNSPFNAYNISSLSPSSNYPGLIVDHEIRARYTAVGPPSAAAQAAAAEMRAQQANQTVGRRRRRRCPPSYGNYATMIAHEILQSPRRKMTLRQIYHHLEARFPDMFSDERPGEVGGKGWQNTVRHSLSINSCFVKIPRNKDDDTDSEEDTDYYVSSDGRMTPRSTKRPSAGYKKGGYWAVDESHLSTISHNGKLDLRRIAATKPGQSHPYAMI